MDMNTLFTLKARSHCAFFLIVKTQSYSILVIWYDLRKMHSVNISIDSHVTHFKNAVAIRKKTSPLMTYDRQKGISITCKSSIIISKSLAELLGCAVGVANPTQSRKPKASHQK